MTVGVVSLRAMPLRDPRALAKVIVALAAVAVVAQGARVVLRALDYRQETALYDLLSRPGSPPGAASDFGDGSLAPYVIEALLVVFVLMPLQATVLVLWLLWQGRIRLNAKLIPEANPTAITRRIAALGAVTVATIIAEVLLYIAGGSGGDPRTLIGLELALDLVVLSLLSFVALSTFTWTREQHRLVEAQLGAVPADQMRPRRWLAHMRPNAALGGGPAVLPFRPVQGWKSASSLERSLVVTTAAFTLLWALLLMYRWPANDADFPSWFLPVTGVMTFAVFLGGPFGCYATARVLRPEPTTVDLSDQQRHMLSALTTAYGMALLTVFAPEGRGVPLYTFGTLWLYLLLVLPLTPVTLAWGLASAIARRGQEPPHHHD